MKQWIFILCLLSTFSVTAQNITQTIRGTVVDQESKFPLIGVNVVVQTEDGIIGNTTDVDGTYRLEGIPLGRQSVEFTYIGYEPVTLSNIIINSGKEVILDVEMEESVIGLGTVEVVGQRSGDARNEMALISARQFSVEETDRYAGSRGDPGRMASNFAGVQGADDSRNDIVIRGNSPQGVLWRFEGVNIPNPNHFAIAGTGGGPVTILNNKYLSDSDFFTGAFPAEFGNSIAGVFDLKMRNGNNEQHEFSGQLGLLGTELFAEGPLNKEKKSSYLLSYRYSTLQLFSFLGLQLGTDAVPQFQDGAFRLNFPRKNGGNIALWGVGGFSTIDIVQSDQEAPTGETDLFASNDRDQYFTTWMGVGGLSWTQPLDQNTFVKATLSASKAYQLSQHDQIFRRLVNNQFELDSLPPILDFTFEDIKYSAYLFLNKKLSKKATLKVGINADWQHMRYLDSVRIAIVDTVSTLPVGLTDWEVRWDANQGALVLQPYVQFKFKFSEKLTGTAGLNSLYFGINDNSFSPIEPRIGLSYAIKNNQKLNFGYGLHSQNLPGYLYFYGQETINRDPQEHNLGIGLVKSHHLVLGYDWAPSRAFRVKVETYFQYLYDIPVEQKSSSFSIVNAGSGFSRLFPDTLVNEGIGRNYGLELTLERFFNGGYYFLVTGSLFDSKYQGSDQIWRNTTFNGRFAFNGVIAKEFGFDNGSTLNLGGKVTMVGGRWYGPVDEEASAIALEIIYEDETQNSIQFEPYFRLDGKISYRWNRPKITHEFSVDFVNVTNRRNILTLTYAPFHPEGSIQREYQLGFLPVFFYKIDF